MDNEQIIEQRLHKLKEIYHNLEEIIDKIPEGVPPRIKKSIADAVLNNSELKGLVEGIDNRRPPRVFMIGRTGVGKSSLINAICESYVASVNDVNSCTKEVEIHKIVRDGRLIMEVCDSRGFAESESISKGPSAEELLIEQVNQFTPDVAIFVLDATRRDDIQSDVSFLKKLSKTYQEQFGTRLPIVAVLNKCDGVSPAWLLQPEQYTKAKLDTIEEKTQYYKNIIDNNGLSINGIIAVSSLIGWKTADGREVTPKEIEDLTIDEIEALDFSFDGRYHIEELVSFLEGAIYNSEARMGLLMAARFNSVLKRIAKSLCNSFSTISAGIAATPIPVSDFFVLCFIQAILVLLIEIISGKEASLKSAFEFIAGVAGVAAIGFGFRWIAQQGAKLINTVAPAVGSVISAGIAYGGTKVFGETAILYFIDGESMDVAKEYFAKKIKLIKSE